MLTMEPWSSRYLTRRSRTTLGEMSDATRRKNSQEVSRLEVAVRHMDRELQVRSSDLSHEQLLLQRSLMARPATSARRQSLTNSAANLDSLKRREKDNMSALDGRCRNFLGGQGDGGAEEEEGEEEVEEGMEPRRHRIPSMHHQHHQQAEEGGEAASQEAARKSPTGSSPAAATTTTTRGGATPRERRYGVAHATDMQLDIDPADQENRTSGYSPLRRTSMQQHKFRRTSNCSPSGGQASSRATTRSQHLDPQSSTSSVSTSTTDGATSGEDATHALTQRKKSLPVVMGRQMMRHDRASKSRESLLLPNLGQGRSPSPIGDLRVKVTYADGEELSSMSDVPFKPHLIRSQRSLPNDFAGPVSPSARGPRLEIDLSIPMATTASNPSSPRPSGRPPRREKTYTV